jgi:hypothetical protein
MAELSTSGSMRIGFGQLRLPSIGFPWMITARGSVRSYRAAAAENKVNT